VSPTDDDEPDPTPASDRRAALLRLVPRYVPIIGWLPRYHRADLGPDVLGGLTSWGVMVPVALAYASLAGLPPEYGLITAFAALAAYAVFGTSRHLRVTTSSTMAVMSLSLVAPLAGGDPAQFVALSAALALIVGAILVIAGFARLGFISEFLAKPVVTGFVFGVAVTIIVGQLPKLLGIPSTSGSVFDQLRSILETLPQTDPLTLTVGALSLLLILVLQRVDRRIPGPLVALILGIAAVVAFDLAGRGVEVVGEVATLMPSIGLPDVGIGDLAYLLTGAVGIVFLAVGESLGSARSFAARHHYEIDSDQELVALGASNTASGLFGGFIVDASLSQSATAEAAGSRTQVSSLLTSALVLATALLLAPLFENLPQAVLGAVVIASVLSLIDLTELRRY
jgi:MFS superfamily sulfate permease-like transporter